MKGKLGRTVVTAVEPGSPAALQCPTLEPGMVLVAVDAAPIGPAGGKINRADPDFGPVLPASSRESQSNRWVSWKKYGSTLWISGLGGALDHRGATEKIRRWVRGDGPGAPLITFSV